MIRPQIPLAKPAHVVSIAPNSWLRDADGRDHEIVEHCCAHVHRTAGGLARCTRRLTRRLPDGSYLARWYRAEWRYVDGERLCAVDEEAATRELMEGR